MEFKELIQQPLIIIDREIIQQALPLLHQVFAQDFPPQEQQQLKPIFDRLTERWQQSGNAQVSKSKDNLTALRYFIDSLYELSFLNQLPSRQQFVPIEALVEVRHASQRLGYFKEGNRGYGAYYDDKNLTPFLNPKGDLKLLNQFFKDTQYPQSIEPTSRLSFHNEFANYQWTHLPVELARKRTFVRFLIANHKLGFI